MVPYCGGVMNSGLLKSLPSAVNTPSLNVSEHVCELLFRNSKHAIFAHIICIAVLFYLFSNIIPFEKLLFWFAVLSIALIIKWGISWQYFKRPLQDKNINYWYKWFIAGSLILGVAWGAVTIALFPEDNVDYQLLLIIIAIGLASGASFTQSVDKFAVVVFSQPIMLAIAVRLYFIDSETYQVTAALILVLDIPVILGAWNSSEASFRLHESAVIERNMNEAKTNFLANMSHEIRTPMNAVVGIGYLLEKTQLSEKQSAYVSKLQQASESLLGIINSILDFSRIEAGQLELEETSFSLVGVLDTVKTHVETQAHKKSLSFDLELDENLEENLVGDPLRLTQVLTNLSANAIKFTQEGGVILQVKRLEDKKDQIKIEFSVIDTGPGIAEKDQSKLFESFTQLNTSDTRKHGGTGLGLAISQRILSMMDSSIEVESVIGEGTTFSFQAWFDVVNADFEAIEEEQKPATALAFIPVLSGKDILLVDDDELNQEIAKEILTIYGLKVRIASSAKEAFWLLSEDLPDLVLMDLQMPEMTGYEALDVIHSNPAWSDIPVIALTANARIVERKKALAYGMDGFLTKPIDPYKLKQTLLDWIPHEDNQFGENTVKMHIVQKQRDSAAEVKEKLDNVIDMLGAKSAGKFFKKIDKVITKEKPTLLRILKAKKWDDAAILAHRLKGSLNLYGSTKLEELLVQIDDKAVASDDVDNVCVALQHEFDLVQKIIKSR